MTNITGLQKIGKWHQIMQNKVNIWGIGNKKIYFGVCFSVILKKYLLCTKFKLISPGKTNCATVSFLVLYIYLSPVKWTAEGVQACKIHSSNSKQQKKKN